MPTIKDRVTQLRAKFHLGRTQLFIEGRTLTLQGLGLGKDGTYGCEWVAERGDSLHTALDEAEEYLQKRINDSVIESGRKQF